MTGSDQARPVELFYWPTPNCRKITIMLEECGLAYTVRFVDINKGDQHRPEFLALAPNNKIPAIIDPDGPGNAPLSVFESGAILQYLGRKTGKLYPREERRRSEVEQWLFWQVGGLGPMAGQCQHFRNVAPEKLAYAIDRFSREVARLYGVLERQLAGRDHIAGDYSIADIACYPWIRLWKAQGQDIAEFPRLAAWLERVGARPAVERGMGVGRDEAARNNPPGLSAAHMHLLERDARGSATFQHADAGARQTSSLQDSEEASPVLNRP